MGWTASPAVIPPLVAAPKTVPEVLEGSSTAPSALAKAKMELSVPDEGSAGTGALTSSVIADVTVSTGDGDPLASVVSICGSFVVTASAGGPTSETTVSAGEATDSGCETTGS